MLPPRAPSLTLLRTFSTTPSPGAAQKQKLKRRAAASAARSAASSPIPPYPYGAAKWYKQADRGLYGTSRILFGNIVSKKNEIKTRRTWHPNMHSKRLWSDALDRFVRVKVQARVLRTIDKVGGLDAYLLGDTVGRVKELGPYGWKLRWRVMGTESVRARFREERKRLGVPEEGLVLVGSDGGVLSEEGFEEEVRPFDEELDNVDRVAEMEGERKSLVTGQVEDGEQPHPREAQALVREAQDMERPLVRKRPREETDAGLMEEQEAPTKEEKKSLFQRWFRR